MEDIKILEAVERYITGQMSPDERVYFEQLRKSNPEIDQAVVEHTFFLQQMNRFDEVKKIKATLNDTHIHLAEKGMIASPRLQGKARVVYLYNRYKRVSAIAASIAGITALTISALVWSLSPGKPMQDAAYVNFGRELNEVKSEVNAMKAKDAQLTKEIDSVKENTQIIEYRRGGTGFLIDAKGYLVTNAHIIKNAKHVAVQANNGEDFRAEVVYSNPERDIAILKITDKGYKPFNLIPYTIKHSASDLAESIFTLGYPRNDIVYGDGYIAAKTGDNGDTLTCQISIPANKGNSGSPILNRNGEVIGILKKGNTNEGVAFAIHSKYINEAVTELQKNELHQKIKISSASSLKGKEREQQVKIVTDYVYMVKVD